MTSESTPAGINVIGHLSGNLGLGVVARNVVEMARSLGRPVAALDVDAGHGRSQHDARYDDILVANAADLPHAINVFVVALAKLEPVLATCPPAFFDGSRLNAALCFWELPTVPEWGRAALDRMDVVIAATDFMDAVYRQHLASAIVVPARIPVQPPGQPVAWRRADHGIPADAVVFVCGFEPASDVNRKNPLAVIQAFIDGVGRREEARLLVRINNARTAAGQLDGVVAKLERAAGGHPRIQLLTQPLSYPEVIGMYRDAQVYVSLHRAEGLGLGMAEAMLMERPVIATGWSGNLTFMSHATACLVSYRLVPARPGEIAYRRFASGEKALWADPRVDEAAAMMTMLMDDPALRQRIGQRASAAMIEFNQQAGEGRFLSELDSILDLRRSLSERAGYVRQNRDAVYAPVLAKPPSGLKRLWWRWRSAAARRG